MGLWPFSKKPEPAKPQPASAKQKAAQQVMAQMKGLRAEIGAENLDRLVSHLRLEDLKNQMREQIASDPKKRDRLLDELRLNLRDRD